MAQMLDELMGPSRNACAGDEQINFEHTEVCKDFLVDFCPNDLFRNTKVDLGFCTLRHDENLKEAYKNSSRFGKFGYEDNFLERIRGLDRDVRRRIEKNMKRLEESSDENTKNVSRQREQEDAKRREMTNEIDVKMKEAQRLCEEGNVSAGEALIREAEALEQERDRMQKEQDERLKKLEQTANELNKPMQVCQVCGCFMLVNDAPQRVDDHLTGKMHVAYARIRNKIEEMDNAKEEERKKRLEERSKRDKERESDRDKKKRSRSRSRDRKRERSKDRGERDRRDRDRDHDRRDRDRDRRGHSDRGRGGDRDRERDRRHR